MAPFPKLNRRCLFGSNIQSEVVYPLLPNYGWFEQVVTKVLKGFVHFCPICGKLRPYYIVGDNLRETCICSSCGATNRKRQIAWVISHTSGSRNYKSLKDFGQKTNRVIYNTESSGPIHNVLSLSSSYICSEYFGLHYESGQIVNGVMHQNLMNLSLLDESVDLVISSDVLEHVPHPYMAHAEIYRILRKGGSHVFTLPFLQTEYLDHELARLNSDGSLTYLEPPQYHGDPLRPEGALVFRIFALEMLIKLARMGFRTTFFRLRSLWNGILGSNAIVFMATK